MIGIRRSRDPPALSADAVPGGLRRVGEGLWKEPVKGHDAPKLIDALDFSIMKPEEVLRAACMEVVSHDLYQDNVGDGKVSEPGGLLDERMGPIDIHSRCKTCGVKYENCPGHFGFIKLELPVFHCSFMDRLVKTLQIVCKRCSRILLASQEKESIARKKNRDDRSCNMRERDRIFQGLLQRCAKAKFCTHCGASCGPVKRHGAFRIVHYPDGNMRRPKRRELEEFDEHTKSLPPDSDVDFNFQAAAKANPDLKRHFSHCGDSLDPLRVIAILEAIPPNEIELLTMAPVLSFPTGFVIQALPIVPLCLRVTVHSSMSTGSTEDDLTVQARVIMSYNHLIKLHILKGSSTTTITDLWENLQMEVARYMHAEHPRLEAPKNQFSDKPLRGMSERFKGKFGRFRNNLSGKRVNFTARTVISPDPNLAIEEVGIPSLVAKTLTYPERVTKRNIQRVRAAVLRGGESHPRIVKIHSDKENIHKYLGYANRKEMADLLKVGYVVERQLQDGDIVLFNRQPSLHRISIMCHRAKILPHRTFRFNECVCGPYNADFDGDEMNIHVPQTEEARAEALELMGVHNNLATPGNGELLIKATQDFLTSSFKMTCKDFFLDRAEFSEALCMMDGSCQNTRLPRPVILKPVELWTGKQLLSTLLVTAIELTMDSCQVVSLTSESKEASFSLSGLTSDTYPLHICSHDGYVCFRGGELLCGQVGKRTLGGSKGGVLFAVAREVG